MKWKIARLFMPLLIIGFVLPMILPGSDGKPIMRLDDWLPNQQTLVKLMNQSIKLINSGATLITDEPVIGAAKPTLYKWQDAQGRWQFTNDVKQVPEEVLPRIKAQTLPTVVNTMQPPVMTESGEMLGTAPSVDVQPSLAKLPDLIDEAKKVRAQLEAKNKAIEAM